MFKNLKIIFSVGFLTTEDEVIPPNLGLKDQLFALEWVHENIGLFGGNKSHITIAGESAGSIAIGWHLLGPWQNKKGKYLLEEDDCLFINSICKINHIFRLLTDNCFSQLFTMQLFYKVVHHYSFEEVIMLVKKHSIWGIFLMINFIRRTLRIF